MKGSLRQVVTLALIAVVSCLFVGTGEASPLKKPCKPKTAKKCKKAVSNGRVGNKPPIASFTFSAPVVGAPSAFDASGSRDPDGKIVSYLWEWKLDATGAHASPATGVTASPTFSTAGTWTVTLTITDNMGATTKATKTVTVVEPTAAVSTLTIGAGIGDERANGIKTGFEIAKVFFAKLGVPAAWHADVYAEPTLDAILADYSKVTGSEGFARTQCAQGCAFANGKAVFIYPGSTIFRPNQLWSFAGVPVHELWHTVQYTLAQNMYGHTADGLSTDGPTWLREGSAEFVAYTALMENGVDGSPLRRNPLYAMHNSYGGTTLESTATGQGNEAAYDLGFFATELLVKNSGFGALLSYWAKIGQGTTWPTAFQEAFGRTPEQFYTEFAQYRTTLS